MLFKKLPAVLLSAIPIIADKRILDMDVAGTVGVDGSLTVTENLKARAEKAGDRGCAIRCS